MLLDSLYRYHLPIFIVSHTDPLVGVMITVDANVPNSRQLTTDGGQEGRNQN